MPKMYLRQLGITYTACAPFTKNKEYKNLNKQEVQNTFIKTNQIKLAFNTTWLTEILRIYLEEQLLIECYTINHKGSNIAKKS